jgi:hypothetical protein
MNDSQIDQAQQLDRNVAADLYARATGQMNYAPRGISLEGFLGRLSSIKRKQHLIRLLERESLSAREKRDAVEAIGRAAETIVEHLKKPGVLDLFASYKPATDGSLAPWQVEPRKRRRTQLFHRLAHEVAGEAKAIDATDRELIEARRGGRTLRWSAGKPEIEQVERRAQDVTGLYGADLPHPEGELARDLVRLWHAIYGRPPGEADFGRFAQECCSAMNLKTPSRATLARALREIAPSVAHTVP